MAFDWFQNHRYSLTVIALVFVAVLILPLPILGFVCGYISETVARLLMVGIGAFGTVLLATITLLTLVDNRILVQERIKEREKPLMEDMLRKIVWPAVEIVDENKDKLGSEDMDWSKAAGPFDDREFEMINVNLEPIARRGDPITSDRFVEKFQNTTNKMIEYDKKIMRLDKLAGNIFENLRSPISEYIEDHEITYESHKLVDPDDVINFLLIGDKPARDDDRPDFWVENKDKFKRIAWNHDEKNLEEFYNVNRELFNYSNVVREALVEVREEIEPEFGIYRE